MFIPKSLSFSLLNMCCYFKQHCLEHNYTNLCTTGKFTGHLFNATNGYFGVIALVGRKNEYTIIFTFILLSGGYTEDFIFLKAHRRLWKCKRSHLNWVCLPYIRLYPISLTALASVCSNPLLTCSNWKAKKPFPTLVGG